MNNEEKKKVSDVVTVKSEKDPGKGVATWSGELGVYAVAEIAFIGRSSSDSVSGSGGALKGCATEAHGFELSGKIIAVSYTTLEA